jgi:hypothetical protein
MNKQLVILLCAFLGTMESAQAHHSYAAFFQVDERIRLEGVVEQFLAQNPHGYIVFNVKNERGEPEQWRAEMPGWVGLSRGRGWTADDLKPGDPITIVGAPASTGDATLIRADDIVMPDGWTRHLFNDPATGRRREATPPPGAVVDVSSTPRPFYPPPRTDGEWAGLDVVWGPNSGTSDDPRDIAAAPVKYDGLMTEPARQALAERVQADDPGLRCIKPTLLISMISPNPIRFTNDGEHIRVEAERWDTVRTIYMDDREPPAGTPHTINGYSVGRFEGDELVIDTTHITAGWQLPGRGPAHSDALEVTERYRVTEDGRLEVTYTIEDPATFTAPVSWQRFNRPADLQILNSYNCQPSPGSGYSWERG